MGHHPINRLFPLVYAALEVYVFAERVARLRAVHPHVELVSLTAVALVLVCIAMLVLLERAEDAPLQCLAAAAYLGACALAPSIDARSWLGFVLGLSTSPQRDALVPAGLSLLIVLSQWPMALLIDLVFPDQKLPRADAPPESLVRGLLRVDYPLEPSPELASEIARRPDVETVSNLLVAALEQAASKRRVREVQFAATYLGWLRPDRLVPFLDEKRLDERVLIAVVKGAAQADAKDLLPRIAELARAKLKHPEGVDIAAACVRVGGDLAVLRFFIDRLDEGHVRGAFIEAGPPVVPLLEELILDPRASEERLSSLIDIAAKIGGTGISFIERLARTEVDPRIKRYAQITLKMREESLRRQSRMS